MRGIVPDRYRTASNRATVLFPIDRLLAIWIVRWGSIGRDAGGTDGSLRRCLVIETITSEEKESIMGSTTDKVAGKANELAGQARQGLGKAMDDEEMQAKGIVQEAKGDAQQAKGKAKDAIKDVIDRA